MHRLAAFTFVASLIAAAAQQQEIPRFRSGVGVVQFTVTVLDKDRHPHRVMGGTVSPTGTGSVVDAYDFAVRAPDVAGRYVVTITASNGKHSARRILPVTVR